MPWHTDVYASQSFQYESSDMRMDVTPIMKKWLDNTYPNNAANKPLLNPKFLSNNPDS